MKSKKIATIALAATALLLAVIFHRPLIEWFSGDSKPTATQKKPKQFSDEQLGMLQEAMSSLDQVRAQLAADTTLGVDEHAQRVAAMLRHAGAATVAADALANAKDVDDARKKFASVTEQVVALAYAEPRLQEGWRIYECPMVTDGYNKWLQHGDSLENPYMGKKMLGCGSPSTFAAVDVNAPHDHSEIEYYTCPMHPSVKKEEPGNCPICGMTLTPVTKGELESGVVMVDAVRRQKIGVKTAHVEERSGTKTITTVGRVTYDEQKLRDVTLKFGGFVEKLYVDQTGQTVKPGQALFLLYSPELYAAQIEFLQAVKSTSALKDSAFADGLVKSARKRLELWDIGPKQIDALIERGEAIDRMPIVAPAGGVVIEKNIVAGSKVMEGMTVYRLADLDTIWIEADVYEGDLASVKIGQTAQVTLPYVPNKTFTGKVSFIYPFLQDGTRTGRVRIEMKNPGVELKPEMFANVTLEGEAAKRVVVPESAVIFTGPRRLVFVDLGEGRLKPVEVKLGEKVDGAFEVLDGVKAGDVVVTSGNFLIAAESRLKGATKYWSSDGSASPAPTGGAHVH